MDEILANLLVPDNDKILQATEALRNAFKSPEAVPALCNILTSCPSPQIRQYAAVLLRKRFAKAKNWNKLTPDVQNGVKSGILPLVVNETEKSVKVSVVQFIAVIAKNDAANGGWPDLQKFVQALMTSQTQSEVELGMFIMSVLTDISLEIFSNQSDHFVGLFTQALPALNDLTSVLGYYTVVTMTKVLPVCETDQSLRNVYLKAIPAIMKSIPALANVDEEKACTVLDFFSDILDVIPKLINPHISIFVQFCLQVSGDKAAPAPVRERTFGLIDTLCRVKRKTVVKQQMLKPIIDVLFTTMCEAPEDAEDDEDYFSDDDADTPYQCATHVLGSLSIYLPPKKLIDHVFERVSSGIQGEDIFVRRACYYALGIVTEGSSECIKNKYLSNYILYVKAGITDSAPIVRNAALFALGQAAEHLQPDISSHADELMPILFEYLSHLRKRQEKGGKEPKGLHSMFFALESFSENLEENLVPFLPVLVEHLLVVMDPKYSVSVQELSISTVGSVASSVGASILPYFPNLLERLKVYLLQQHTEETSCLQVQALQTLATLARTLGAEHFGPLVEETVALGLKILKGTDDPDLKRASYCLLGALCTVTKEESASFLPILVESIILTMKNTDGLVVQYKDEEAAFPVYEDLSDTADEEDIETASVGSSEVAEVAIENPYMDEKEEAIICLKDLVIHTGTSFLPYLQNCFEEVFKMISYPYDDVRKSAFETLAYFCVGFSKIETAEGVQARDKAISVLVVKCGETVSSDDEILVVNAAIEALGVLLKEIGPPVIANNSHLEIILTVVNDVLLKKTECQQTDDDPEEDLEGESEQDELLMETAGEIIPSLGKAMPAEQYVKILQGFLPSIGPKLTKSASTAQRSFFIGTLAECMEPASEVLQSQQDFSTNLLGIFSSLMQDKKQDVRNNAIFGLGELVLHAKESLFYQYMEILQSLSTALSQETHGIVIDNICGALARLVITNVDLVPMDQVFPVFLEKLPLREDFAEHLMILKCFGSLYQKGHASLQSHISTVIRICCLILLRNMGKEEIMTMCTELLVSARKDFTAAMSSVLQTFTPEEAASITNRLSS